MFRLKMVVVSALVFSFIAGLPLVAMADLTMGVFPRRSMDVTKESFTPLAEKLSRELGETVKLVVSKDYSQFWQRVQNKEFDIAHMTQYQYIMSHEGQGYNAIVANEEFGEKTLSSALFVNSDSEIKTVADLKGKTILLGGGKTEMGGYIGPMSILKENGIENDVAIKYAKSCPNAIMALAKQKVDCSGTGAIVLDVMSGKKKIDKEKIRVLAQSKQFVQMPWAVKGEMVTEKQRKIQQIMVTLKEDPAGQKILQAAKVTDFFPVHDGSYAGTRALIGYVEGR